MIHLKSKFSIFIIGAVFLGLFCVGCGQNHAKVQDKKEVTFSKTADADKNKAALPAMNKDGKSPKLVFNELTHDFGKQVAGPPLTHTFIFHNKGDGMLVIEKVKAG